MALPRTLARHLGSTSKISSNLSRSAHLSSLRSSRPATRCLSVLAPAQAKKASDTEGIRIPLEELEKKQNPNDIGHSTTTEAGTKPRVKRTLSAFSMEGKVCVVTGAARGLGNLMARSFLEAGASRVAFLDLKAEEAQKAASEASDWIKTSSGVETDDVDLRGLACDISDEQSVKKAFEQIHSEWGQIDVVVNSAGIVENFPAEEYETSRYRKLMQINLDGAWFVANEAARYMIKDKTHGSIVLIASMSASIVNFPQMQAPYNASKAAVKHLSSSLAVEWAKHNIRVNTISPGYVLTDLTRVMIEKSDYGKMLKREWEARIPLNRMAVPEDLKGVAVFLASDASKYVTASDVLVDGGYCAM